MLMDLHNIMGITMAIYQIVATVRLFDQHTNADSSPYFSSPRAHLAMGSTMLISPDCRGRVLL